MKLLSLETWNANKSVLVRLENMGLQESQTVSLSPLLSNIGQPVGAMETTMDGNMNITDMKRLVWNQGGNQRKPRTSQTKVDIDNINLKPKQIRTFVIDMI